MDNLLYSMKLHDTLFYDDFQVTRVPGGWLYSKSDIVGKVLDSVFVQFNNEFQEPSN